MTHNINHLQASLYSLLATAYRRYILDLAEAGTFTEQQIAESGSADDCDELRSTMHSMVKECEIVIENGIVSLGRVSKTDDEVRVAVYESWATPQVPALVREIAVGEQF